MPDELKNIYGLSEGVFKACQFLGLKFPPTVPVELQPPHKPVPSDYFGEDFEFDDKIKTKLCRARKWTNKQFTNQYKAFAKKFSMQKPIKQFKTNLNVYFCDYVLFANARNGANHEDYFDFEFYNKPLELRDTFLLSQYSQRRVLFNERGYMTFVNNKVKTNKLFAEYLHRDWFDTRDCTFDEFKVFVQKHPRFFSKPVDGNSGKGAQIITINSNENLENIFVALQSRNSLLEEIVVQHEALAAFWPNTVNTIRVNTILDAHNVVHILGTSGRFGRADGVVDNFHGGGCCYNRSEIRHNHLRRNKRQA